MAMPSVTTNQEVPSQGEPFVFPSFVNVGPLLMATLSLLGLTIELCNMVIPYLGNSNTTLCLGC